MSKSEPYREASSAPIYFEPKIEKISYDEYKASKAASEAWRGFQIASAIFTLSLSFLCAYHIQANQAYWLAFPFIVSFCIVMYSGRHAKFHRNIVLEYLRHVRD